MFIQFLRENKFASAALAILRLYVGYQWLMAGYEKLTGGFDATGFLKGAAAKAVGDHPAVQAWWAHFLQSFAIPNVHLFNVLIPWGEILVGLGLLLGLVTRTAVFFGLIMNFAFLFSGTTSTNPQLVLLSLFILVAGHNAGTFGIDGLLKTYGKSYFLKKKHDAAQ